jgi:hypothetical protein
MKVSVLSSTAAVMNDNQHYHFTGTTDLRRSYTKLDFTVNSSNSGGRDRGTYVRQTSQHHHHQVQPSVVFGVDIKCMCLLPHANYCAHVTTLTTAAETQACAVSRAFSVAGPREGPEETIKNKLRGP